MFATTPLAPFRGSMTEPTTSPPTSRWLGLRQAARRLNINHTYLLRLVPRMSREGVTVSRPTERVILFDEAQLVAWWRSWHPDWTDPDA